MKENVENIIVKLQKNPETRAILLHDFGYVRTMLLEVGLEAVINLEVTDHGPTDREILGALEATMQLQANYDINRKLGNLWWVIRRSTEKSIGDKKYSVALLNVKPKYHYRVLGGGKFEIVKTDIVHFSMRARLEGGQQTYRGRVLRGDNALYFLGTRREELPKLGVMAWWLSSEERIAPRRMRNAEGVTMTVDAYNATVVTPVIGVPIQRPEIEYDGDDEEEYEQIAAMTYYEKIRNQSARAHSYTTQEIIKEFGEEYGTIIAKLENLIEMGTKWGYFEHRPMYDDGC